MSLRDYQQEGLEKIRRAYRDGARRVVYVLPTGAGKSYMMGFLLAQKPQDPAWFCVHTRVLLDQVIKMFEDFGLDFGVIAGGYKENPKAPKKVVSVQAAATRVLTAPKLVIFDECHHAVSKRNRAVLQGAEYVLGVTATPLRLDGKGLGTGIRQTLIEGPTYGRVGGPRDF